MVVHVNISVGVDEDDCSDGQPQLVLEAVDGCLLLKKGLGEPVE